ncbi:MAG: helix-turn-helix transcriptional regulator [Patescibacteria group bacterium]
MSDFKKLEKLLKVAGNQRRLAILAYLKKVRVSSVGKISENLNMSYHAASKHLRLLLNAELLDREQKKFEAHYTLSKNQHRLVSNLLELL